MPARVVFDPATPWQPVGLEPAAGTPENLSACFGEDAGEVPTEVLRLIEGTAAEINLPIDAALTGDKKKFEQAVYLSLVLHRRDRTEELSERLLEAIGDMLAQFKVK